MTNKKFLDFLESGESPQSIDKDYDGGCLCGGGEVELPQGVVGFHARCWRVSENVQDLHIWGTHPDLKDWAKKIKKALDDQEWYNPYTIIYDKF